jgi:transcription factor C subunit 3
MREHTAYPKSTEDFLRAANPEDEELDWSSENVRLAAFIVVTTLLGGVDRVVDWGLMMRLMPDQT